MFLATKILGALVVPPALNLLGALAGLLVMPRRRILGLYIVVAALLTLYLFSIHAVAGPFIHSLESYPPVTVAAIERQDPGALVVLGGGQYDPAPEYDGATVSPLSLLRLRYAARLYHRTHLPVLVSGGKVSSSHKYSEAQLMRRTLAEDFLVPVLWTENESRNTAENALFSARILTSHGIHKIVLVTDAASMPRAVQAFHRVGIDVVAAPTYYHLGDWGLFDWVPSARALEMSAYAMHEYIGQVWYRIRY